jgi:tetratricopeptide (TPR) repeat protein
MRIWLERFHREFVDENSLHERLGIRAPDAGTVVRRRASLSVRLPVIEACTREIIRRNQLEQPALVQRLLAIKEDANTLFGNIRTLEAACDKYAEALVEVRRYGGGDEAKRIAAICMANRAQGLLDLAKYADAAESARTSIRLNPGFIKSHLRLGDALIQLHRFQEALETFQRAQRIQGAEPPLLALAASRIADLLPVERPKAAAM